MLLITGLLLSSCGLFGSKDNTEPPAPLVEFAPTLSLKTLWTADARGGRNLDHFKLVLGFADGKILAASPTGYVTAFDFHTGKSLWQITTEQTISGGVGTGESLVLVGSNHGEVIALAVDSGKELWRTKVSSEVLSAPQVNQGIVVVRTVDGKLFGLNSQTGQRLWVYERSVPLLTLRGTSTPVLVDDHLIAGFDNGNLAMLELRTGKLLWEATVAVAHGRTELERMVDIDADPIVADQTVYVTSYQGRTIAVDMNGQPLWERDVAAYAGLGLDAEHLYVSDSQSHLWALKRDSGASIWQQDKLQARGLTAPTVLDKYVIVGDKEGYLHWLRREDGQFATRYRVGSDSILVPPLVIDQTVLVYTSSGEIIALQVGG